MALLTLKSGVKNVATAGTELPLVTASTHCKGFKITAKAANSGVVYLGDSTVSSSNGFQLAAGASVTLQDLYPNINDGVFVDLANIYVDAANNNDGVTFVYFAYSL